MSKRLLFCMCLVLSSFSLFACGEESSCGEEVDAALAQVPETLRGELILAIAGMEVVIPATATAAADSCGLYFSMVQKLNPECGERFSGTLSYEGEDTWRGVISTTDLTPPTHVSVELTSGTAALVEISAEITESGSVVCQDQQLTGHLRAQ